MSKIYIRRSSKPVCGCGAAKFCYSLIQDKIVRATICEECYDVYVPALKGFELVFVTFDKLPNPIPSFLRRVDESQTSKS
jgi:hypothetical protein